MIRSAQKRTNSFRHALCVCALLVAASTIPISPSCASSADEKTMSESREEFRVDALDVALLRAAAINWDPTETGAPTIDPACPFGSARPLDDLRRWAAASDTRLDGDGKERMARMEQTLQIFFQTTKLAVGNHSVRDKLFGCSSPLDNISRMDLKAAVDAPSIKRADPRQETISFTITEEHLSLLQNLSVRLTDWEDDLDDSDLLTTAGVDPKRPYGRATNVVADIAKILNIAQPKEQSAFLKEFHRLQGLHDDMRAVVIIALADGAFLPGEFVRGESGMWERKGD